MSNLSSHAISLTPPEDEAVPTQQLVQAASSSTATPPSAASAPRVHLPPHPSSTTEAPLGVVIKEVWSERELEGWSMKEALGKPGYHEEAAKKAYKNVEGPIPLASKYNPTPGRAESHTS